MSRLPPGLQPAWPLLKRLHRLATLVLGLVFRRTSRLAGDRALPRRATTSADVTAAREPGAVTLHVSGPAVPLRRIPPRGTPEGHWIFDRDASYDVPRRFTLEIADGTVVGDYAAIVTPGGTLDLETSSYFGIAGWREHPVFLRPRLPVVERFDGTLVNLACRGGSSNYYHFLLDVLPRWGIVEESFPGLVPDALHVPAAARYQRELLGLAGLGDLPRVETRADRAVRATRLLAPCEPNPDLVAPAWVVDWLRTRLPATETAGLPTRLYLTRGDKPNTRRLVEEAALWPELERRGFVRLDPGTVTVQQQIDHVAAAEVIVAPHGAALANLVFARPGLKLLELFAPNYVNTCYWAMCQELEGVEYRYLVAGDHDDHRPGRAMNGVLTDIRLPPAAILDALDDLL